MERFSRQKQVGRTKLKKIISGKSPSLGEAQGLLRQDTSLMLTRKFQTDQSKIPLEEEAETANSLGLNLLLSKSDSILGPLFNKTNKIQQLLYSLVALPLDYGTAPHSMGFWGSVCLFMSQVMTQFSHTFSWNTMKIF